MTKRMLIDATHAEETRVVMISGNRLEEFDFESSRKKQIKGNIYLAKVTRVEPSLQAAFVEYGGNRHGFLAFSEIHTDYYRIPIADREALNRMVAAAAAQEEDEENDASAQEPVDPHPIGSAAGDLSAAETSAEEPREIADAMGHPAELTQTAPDLPSEADGGSPGFFAPQQPSAELGDAAPAFLERPLGEQPPREPEARAGRSGSNAAQVEADAIDRGADPAFADPKDTASSEADADAPVTDLTGAIDMAAAAIGGAAAHQAEDAVETVGGDEVDELRKRHRFWQRRYKIQEVIRKRQILLVQVAKEERGTKGAALTTYISLAGRYCVLMPNTPRGGGISRKITSQTDRRRLKDVLGELEVPDGMAVIVRTAGMERSKPELRRDLDFLLKTWDDIRERALTSTAPALIYEEANLIKRAVRDLYSSDVDEILVEGEEGFKAAKSYMKLLMPSHVKKVTDYSDRQIPLFHRYQVESQIDNMHSPTVQLRSGGYIVLNPTEALVAIDVNSGRSTRERNIEETAYRTNIEAADEIARQLRLRDLAGLIVIDFIDMEDSRNRHNVERRLKEALKQDRARIQVGRISPFGLLEMSRQRLRPSLVEASMMTCSHCGGAGHVRSTESMALAVLRATEEEGLRQRSSEVTVALPTAVALYIFNHKRPALAEIEQRQGFRVILQPDDDQSPSDFRIARTVAKAADARTPAEASREPAPAAAESQPTRIEEPAAPAPRRADRPETVADGEPATVADASGGEPRGAEARDGDDPDRRGRRRGRRGGRRRRGGRPRGEHERLDAPIESTAERSAERGQDSRDEQPASPPQPAAPPHDSAIEVHAGGGLSESPEPAPNSESAAALAPPSPRRPEPFESVAEPEPAVANSNVESPAADEAPRRRGWWNLRRS